jgi:hypothetical protein
LLREEIIKGKPLLLYCNYTVIQVNPLGNIFDEKYSVQYFSPASLILSFYKILIKKKPTLHLCKDFNCMLCVQTIVEGP